MHNTILYDALLHDALLRGTILYDTPLLDRLYDTPLHDTILYNSVRHSTMLYSNTLYGTLRYSNTQGEVRELVSHFAERKRSFFGMYYYRYVCVLVCMYYTYSAIKHPDCLHPLLSTICILGAYNRSISRKESLPFERCNYPLPSSSAIASARTCAPFVVRGGERRHCIYILLSRSIHVTCRHCIYTLVAGSTHINIILSGTLAGTVCI
mgnify:CR=1 FL=1